MKTSDFDYHLPKELIAQTPIEPRDHSRLMVVSRGDGSIQHRHFYDLPEYLRPGDVMVFKDSRVFPARLYGTRVGTGGRVELLLLHRTSPGTWRALVKPGRRMRQGDAFDVDGSEGKVRGEVVLVDGDGTRIVRLSGEEDLEALGVVPLPPYIHQPLEDAERYQTVYARLAGSVAAPTAGLHFTSELLERIRSMGVELVFVTLHVGWDSFRPVKTEDFTTHTLHSEYWELGPDAAEAVNRAKEEGRKVISVGTTAVRLLEQAAVLVGDADAGTSRTQRTVASGSGWAELFIYPGYRFRVVDALVTNFHLPRSTLLMLTSAFAGRDPSTSSGRGLALRAYAEAADSGYRFYSFGDAMLVV